MSDQELPLSGVRVLDLSEGIAGPGCTKVMAHLGADVIKVERPRTGDVARSFPPFYKDRPHLEGSGLFLYLNMGKRSITLDMELEQGRALFRRLVTDSQIVVESFPPGTMEKWGLGYSVLEALNPSLVMASITPFGQAGPYRDLTDSDIVLQALGGLLYLTGDQDREPLRLGGNPAYFHAAMQAFSGIMGAFFCAESMGVGEYLDIAVVECIAVNAMFSSLNYDLAGRILSRRGDRQPVFRAADGYVGFVLRSENWSALCQVLGRPDLEHDPRFADEPSRQANRPEMLREIAEAVRSKEKTNLYRTAQEKRVPTGYVCTAPDLLNSPQYRYRGFLREIDHPLTGTLTYPGVPWKMDDLPLRIRRAPCLGEHNREVYQNLSGLGDRELASIARARNPLSGEVEIRKLPLQGVRVVDLAMIWAGAAATQYLAVMGAEVIKIEAGRHPDTTRGNWPPTPTMAYADDDPGSDPWNRTSHYLERNKNKYSLVLDLTTPEGQEAVRKLVQMSDIVAENFRVGTMDRMGLSYQELRRVKPDIILISMSSQGVTGPEREYGSFGNILEQTGGIASITGYPGGMPRSLGIQYPDPLTAGISPGLVISALRYRNRTGKGMHIDVSQRELATYTIGEVFLDYVMNGRVWGTIGNQDPYAAPQGCYPCKGEDRWVAISVQSEEQWQNLCKVMDQPVLASDPRFDTVQHRCAHHDELDRIIGQWTSTQDNRQVMSSLQKLGVSAGAVLDGRDFVEDPHLVSRGFWETVDQGRAGIRRHMRPPYGFTRTPLSTRFRAPTFGEHSRFVLKEYLGYSDQDLDSLEKQRVLEYKPHWATQLER